jgi:hypothetical protein
MENKFRIGDVVCFLNIKENDFMVGLLCPDKNKNEYTLFGDYNKVYHCGKVEKIHISESVISYDIQTYSCTLYPMELFKEVYECYVFDTKENAKEYFFKTVNDNLVAIKEWCECQKLEDV